MDKKNELLELQSEFAGLPAVPLQGLVQVTKRRLDKAKSDSNSILLTQVKDCLDVRVSSACLNRALDLLNRLFAVLEQRGFAIEVKEEKDSARPLTCLRQAGEEIQIHIEEKLDRIPHVLTEAEKKKLAKKEALSGKYGSYSNSWELYSWEPPQWDYQPSGQLEFKIDNLQSSGQRQNWSDSERRQLESLLPNISYHILESITYLRNRKLELEERERRWAEEARQRAERERQRLEDQRKIEHLDKLLGQWSKREQLLRFLSWVDDNMPNEARTDDFTQWYEWAKNYAQRLNPLTRQEFYKPEQPMYRY